MLPEMPHTPGVAEVKATASPEGTALALSALRAALKARRPAPGLVHHSDRGSPYASAEYREVLAEHEVVVSATGPR